MGLKNTKQDVANDEVLVDVFEELKRSWPAPLVARTEVSRFSGGVLNSRSMANLDSAGLGPPKIQVGPRKIAYPRDPLVEWMKRRSVGAPHRKAAR